MVLDTGTAAIIRIIIHWFGRELREMVERAMALASATPSLLGWTCDLVSFQRFMTLVQVGAWGVLCLFIFGLTAGEVERKV